MDKERPVHLKQREWRSEKLRDLLKVTQEGELGSPSEPNPILTVGKSLTECLTMEKGIDTMRMYL